MTVNYNASKSNTGNVTVEPAIKLGGGPSNTAGTAYLVEATLAELHALQAGGEIVSFAPVTCYKVKLAPAGQISRDVASPCYSGKRAHSTL